MGIGGATHIHEVGGNLKLKKIKKTLLVRLGVLAVTPTPRRCKPQKPNKKKKTKIYIFGGAKDIGSTTNT